MRAAIGVRGAAAGLLGLLLMACSSGAPTARRPSTPTTTAGVVSGRFHITGLVTTLTAAAASTDPIPAPFTITVPDAGRGGLALPHAIVAGKPESIAWNGGRPLPVTGACALDLGEFAASVDGAGLRVALDGAVRELTPGPCSFGSSVAVGQAGLSAPVDSVAFRLAAPAGFTTSGGAAILVPAPRRYEGRRGPLAVTGTLRVTTTSGDRPAKAVTLRTGTWVVTLSAAPAGGLNLTADLEGTVALT